MTAHRDQSQTAEPCPTTRPIPASAFGPAPNAQGYYVGRVERNLYWVTDGVYQAAFLTTSDGVVLFDAPPSIGHNLQRAIDEIAQANGVSNKVTYLVHTHHHADHAGASSLFGKDVVRIGHEETRRLLLRDDDPARPAPDGDVQRSPDPGDRRRADRARVARPQPHARQQRHPLSRARHADDGRHRERGLGARVRRQPVRRHPGLPVDAGHGADLPVEDPHQRPPGPARHARGRRPAPAVHGGPRGQREDRPRHRRSDALLPEVRRGREHVGRRQGLPRTRSATRRPRRSSRSTPACSRPRTCSPRTSRSG